MFVCRQCRGSTVNRGGICTPCLNGRELIYNIKPVAKPRGLAVKQQRERDAKSAPRDVPLSRGPFSHGTGGGQRVMRSGRTDA